MCFTRKLALTSRVAYRRFNGVHTAQGKEDRRTLDGTEGEVGLWCGYNKGPTGPIQELQRLPGARGLGLHMLTFNPSRVGGCPGRERSVILGLSCSLRGWELRLVWQLGIDASFLGGSWAEHHSTHPSYCVLCKCYWTWFFRQANHWSKSLLSDITDNLWWQ